MLTNAEGWLGAGRILHANQRVGCFAPFNPVLRLEFLSRYAAIVKVDVVHQEHDVGMQPTEYE